MMNTTHPATGEETWYPLSWLNLERGAAPLHIPAPLLRIHACGLLRVEVLCETRETPVLQGRYQSLSEEQMRGRNGSQALTLLKLLLSRPHRHAPKQYLMEYLGHGEQAISEGRLDDLVTKLRGLLCTEQWEHLRTHLVQHVHSSAATGNGYRLAAYPLIWLDTDALHWHVEQGARLERHGEPELACPLWEHAYSLSSRGDYLSDEEYADWAQSKRGEVARGRRTSVHALSRLLVAIAGAAGEAQVLHTLSSYCSQYPLDEDALRPFMELLGKHERFSEALTLYEHACSLLSEDGLTPDERTSDIAQVLRTKQLARKQPERMSENPSLQLPLKWISSLQPEAVKHLHQVPLDTTVISPPHPEHLSLPLARSSTREEKDWAIWFGLKGGQLLTLVDHWFGESIYYQQLQTLLDQEIQVFDAMKPQTSQAYHLSRRQALFSLATFPMALCPVLQQAHVGTALQEKFLLRCAASLTACWHLLKGSEFSLVEQVLSNYLFLLAPLTQQPSRVQQTAAQLLSQAYRLCGIVALHCNDIGAREWYCKQALYFSEIAHHPATLVSAHISLASTLYYRKQPIQAALTYQKALRYQDHISPLQRSRLSAELAVVTAQQGQVHEALQLLEQAQRCYPEYPEHDPSFLYAEFSPASMILEEGLTYLVVGKCLASHQYQHKAWDSFARIEILAAERMVPERIFFEITNHQAETALALGDLEAVKAYLTRGIEGAKQLQSKQRRQEVLALFVQALALWPHEDRLKQVGRLLGE